MTCCSSGLILSSRYQDPTNLQTQVWFLEQKLYLIHFLSTFLFLYHTQIEVSFVRNINELLAFFLLVLIHRRL